MGITPAHAGKRNIASVKLNEAWDHPRTCGEKMGVGCPEYILLGSPPHMRGKVHFLRRQDRRAGITPAHAGKSGPGDSRVLDLRDHPRTCGEKSNTVSPGALYRGSPPHMRGKDRMGTILTVTPGITPAHAGKSIRRYFSNVLAGDHPRTCGEKRNTCYHLLLITGSPPHMRGKVLNFDCVAPAHGITPAHAGKRGTLIFRPTLYRDHPRTCGEKCRQ